MRDQRPAQPIAAVIGRDLAAPREGSLEGRAGAYLGKTETRARGVTTGRGSGFSTAWWVPIGSGPGRRSRRGHRSQ